MELSSNHVIAVLGLALIAIAECGKAEPFQLAPVAGHITLDGRVIPHTRVLFRPQGASNGTATPGPGSVAFCDDAGKFELKTVDGKPGAVVGTHQVTINSVGALRSTAGDTNTGAPLEDAFPDQFNVNTTLTFEVKTGGTDSANFELSSKGKGG